MNDMKKADAKTAFQGLPHAVCNDRAPAAEKALALLPMTLFYRLPEFSALLFGIF